MASKYYVLSVENGQQYITLVGVHLRVNLVVKVLTKPIIFWR